VKKNSRRKKKTTRNLDFITCFSIMNPGKLATTTFIIKTIVVPTGRPLVRRDSDRGKTQEQRNAGAGSRRSNLPTR
jgi:hypothetical protein